MSVFVMTLQYYCTTTTEIPKCVFWYEAWNDEIEKQLSVF